MDPISAVGFAASILTFIDFGHKIVTGTLEVLKSGSLTRNTDITIVLNDFHAVVKALARRPSGKSAHEIALEDLAKRCQEVAGRLSDLLGTLRTRPGGSSWEAMKLALRSMRKKGDVADLEERLTKYRSELMIHLVSILNERQLSIQIQLSDFQSQIQKQSSHPTTKQMQVFRDDVLKAVKDVLLQQQTDPPPAFERSSGGGGACQSAEDGDRERDSAASDHLQLLRAALEKIDDLLRSNTVPSPEIRVLRQLFSPSLYRRKHDVAEASGNTFEWILGSATYGSEDSENKGGKDRDQVKDRATRARRAAASRFLHWLRNGNGVFHISGKAGSGKSTMMKLLLENEKTKEELEKWAGEKQLVSAHFFFWLSGDELQRSLEGFYRAVLFEILIKCPELIRDVFPEAHRNFSQSRIEGSLDELFVDPRSIRKAFEDLVTKSPPPGYRFCIFIDGLDEYGGDGVHEREHQLLADSLSVWAAQDDIKILASSRPHRQFDDTFSDELRIRLHEFTRSDIVLAAREMFENDRCFKQRPEIRDCYAGLIENVADASDGVFLWASLAVRALLNAAGRHDPIDSLEQQLEYLPREFNKLYEKLFMSIEDADRAMAFRMLLLVAECRSLMLPLNALSMTWLRDLDEPEFPTNREIKPYTDEEIEERHLQARCQVEGFTKGLLQIETYANHPFYQGRVAFFHRTVHDFVAQSPAIQEFATRFPNYTDVSTYARLFLAELHFARLERHWHFLQEYRDFLTQIRVEFQENGNLDYILDGYDRAMGQYKQYGDGGISQHLDSSMLGGDGGGVSFIHFMASAGFTGYVERKVTGNPSLLQPQGGMSLLFSAACGREPALVKSLLAAGARPDHLVEVDRPGTSARVEHTVWHLVCTRFACGVINRPLSLDLRAECEVIQYFIEAGADFNCFALLARKKVKGGLEYSEGHPTHAISLRALIQQLDPPNVQVLLKLMEEPKPAHNNIISRIIGTSWGYLVGAKPEPAPFRPADDYAPFHLAMDPAPIDRKPGDRSPPFFVGAVQWRSALMDRRIMMRLC
ncbi:uncharacterized protein B0H64DRAFT_379096 [Chaetomium fimeti]|uniref:NACHT domain-containing protein n=1 Tax=Chaetomium fimeti TaxID=1854472 RepID=A0AAE0LW39_9PEZI|nr:hypothetical protein B0H64DRAFT_379096 [Chaetomium fimeti]